MKKAIYQMSGLQGIQHRLRQALLAAPLAVAAGLPATTFAQGHASHASHAGHTEHAEHSTHGIYAEPAGPQAHASNDVEHTGHANLMDHSASSMGHDMDQASQEASSMDHGDMPMQGGSTPANARDPDAYSGGHVRNAGKFSLPPSEASHMSDTHYFGSVQFDRFEHVRAQGEEWGAYEGEAWYGGTYNRAVVKAEGEVAGGKLRHSETQLLWRHAAFAYWDTELGLRLDHDHGAPNRQWLAFGIKGLAPYWFEVDATAYVGPGGRTALGLHAEYDILLSQKLYLQPAVEMNLYSKDDEARQIGSGLADVTAGLRLKHEITRQLVPYIGVEWAGKFGRTADYARAAGESRQQTRFVAGLSFRF